MSSEPQERTTVIIALPGREYSGEFLLGWTRAINALWENNYNVIIVNKYSSFVTFSRMETMGLDVLRGVDQKPYNGNVKYDVWVTIDSDIIFTPTHLIELIESAKNHHTVVSGLYLMADMKHFPCILDWNEDYFAQNGSFQFITPADVENYRSETQQVFLPVCYNGMGFFACRFGVLEKLQYPYFDGGLQEIKTQNGVIVRDICSEDVAFCRNLKKAGETVYVNTNIRVGHEKKMII